MTYFLFLSFLPLVLTSTKFLISSILFTLPPLYALHADATILVNSNQIFNDDIYEFEQVGIPFLAALGQEILTDLQTNK